MRKLLLAFGFAILLPSASQAAPLCVAGTLDTYIALGAGGCSLDGATVADFFSDSLLFGATEIDADEVLVTPVPGARTVALDFSLLAKNIAGPGDLFDILIRFSLTGGPFDINELSMTGAAATGDGVVTAVEEKCVDGSFAGSDPTTPCSGLPVTLITLESELVSIPFDTATYPFGSFFDVFVTLTVDGGVAGTAELLGDVSVTFTTAPEPSTLLVMGSGVCAFLVRRRRRQ